MSDSSKRQRRRRHGSRVGTEDLDPWAIPAASGDGGTARQSRRDQGSRDVNDSLHAATAATPSIAS